MTHVIHHHKPSRVEAMRWDGTPGGADAVIEWIAEARGERAYYYEHQVATTVCGKVVREAVPAIIAISSPSSVVHIKAGDWVTA